MKLRTQIYSGYLLLALLVLVVGATGIYGLRVISGNFDSAVNRTQPVLTALHDVRLHATTLAFAAASRSPQSPTTRGDKAANRDGTESAEAGAEDAKAEAERKADKAGRGDVGKEAAHAHDGKTARNADADAGAEPSLVDLMAAVSEYRVLIEKHFPDEIGEAKEIAERAETFARDIESLDGHGMPLEHATFHARLDQIRTALDALLDAVAEAAAAEEREFREHQESIERESARQLYAIAAACAIALLCALAGGAALAGHIAQPVRALRAAALKLGRGELETRVTVAAENEMGDLATAFNQMSTDLSHSMVTRDYVESIIESLTEGVLVVDGTGRIERTNESMRRIFDEPVRGALQGRALREVLATGEDLEALTHDPHARHTFECHLRGGKAPPPVVAVSISPVMAGSDRRTRVLLVQDITERKRQEEKLRYLASYDVLTGLPNRRMFLDHLSTTVARLPWNKKRVGLLFCDLDRFKFVNDSLGHGVGDVLLQRITERIREVLRPGDVIGRWAGDEFVVLLDDIAHPDHIDVIADKVVERLRAPVQIGPHELHVTVSVGTSCAPDDGLDADELVKNADLAMYAAKSAGKNHYCRYQPVMRSRSEMRLMLEHALRSAIEAKDQLLVHYQAQQNLQDGSLIGFEALVRWQHPQLGLIAPAQFLPAAEEAGLMAALDESVLRMACGEVRRWREAGWGQLRVAVNLSNQTFQRADLVKLVARIIDDAGVPRDAVELELTEEIVMENVSTAVATMEELCALGVHLSIDDFGTGYSSLSQLKRCPIRVLKIDRSFIIDVTNDESDRAITDAIIALSHKLGIMVLAEGVETEAQLDLLRRGGCDAMQGYLLSKPLPAEALAPWLAARQRPEVA